MPRSSVILAARPVDAQVLAEASGAVWQQVQADSPGLAEFVLTAVDDGAAVQVRTGAGELLLTVLRPRLLPRADEVSRLLPLADPARVPDGSWWTDAYTPWTQLGLVGVLILEGVATLLAGQAIHSRDRAGEEPLPV